jgi:hypothetical protein
MEHFGRALEKAFQEYLRRSRLTQRKGGRSNNSEAGKTTWFDATMA